MTFFKQIENSLTRYLFVFYTLLNVAQELV